MSEEAILIKSDGVIKMEKTFDYMCSKLRNGRYKVVISRYNEKRSLDQNALMWMWFNCIEKETGTTKIDVHDYYCRMFLSRVVCINGVEREVAGGTSQLNTKQLSYFMDQVKADASTELGINLPLPEDRYYSQFINEYRRF